MSKTASKLHSKCQRQLFAALKLPKTFKEKMKRLRDRIAENQEGKKTLARLAILVSMQDEIQEAYDFGWSINSIWAQLVSEKKVDCSYTAFLRTWNKMKNQQADTTQIKELTTAPEKELSGVTEKNKPQECEGEAEPRIISLPPDKPFSYENLKK